MNGPGRDLDKEALAKKDQASKVRAKLSSSKKNGRNGS